MRLPVPAAAGTLFLVFAAGVASQLATGGSPASRVLALGFAILVGLGVAVSGWALLGRRGSQVRT